MIDVLSYAAKKTGKILLENFGRNFAVSHKASHLNLLTEIDELAQETIIDSILHYVRLKGYGANEIGFIGEEENKNSFKKHTFIIDPIDGTTNYYCGVKYFGVSVAYVFEGHLAAAAVYEPYDDALFLAEAGKGALKMHLDQKTKLRSQFVPLKKCLLITNLSKNYTLRPRVLKLCDESYQEFAGIRMYTSIVMDIVHTTDRPHTVVTYANGLLWDLAASYLIAKEAGTEIVDWQGKPLSLDFSNIDKHYAFIAAHPRHMSNLLNIIKSI